MSGNKNLWSRLFGKEEASSCCAVRIEAVPDEVEAVKKEEVKPSCCAVRAEEAAKPADLPPPAPAR